MDHQLQCNCRRDCVSECIEIRCEGFVTLARAGSERRVGPRSEVADRLIQESPPDDRRRPHRRVLAFLLARTSDLAQRSSSPRHSICRSFPTDFGRGVTMITRRTMLILTAGLALVATPAAAQ